MELLDLSGIQIPVERKSIKNMYLRVSRTDGTVKLTVPSYMGEEEIRRFAFSKIGWIRKMQAEARVRPVREKPALPPDAAEILRLRMDRMIPECEAIVGRHAKGWRIRAMKTRWGSCSLKTGIISVNLELAAKSSDCLRYILIHELTHFWVPNHGAAFYSRMDRYLPEWRKIRCELRKD